MTPKTAPHRRNQTAAVSLDGITRSGRVNGVRYDRQSYRAGYVAGLIGRRNEPGPGISDRLAFRSGYIEGKAARSSGALRFRRYRPPRPDSVPWWFADAWPIVPATVQGVPVPRK